jgi:hypothetical protein
MKLRAPDAYKGDQFGTSSSIFKDYLVLSAVGDDDYGSYTGSVYTYKNYDGGWSLQAKLVPVDGQTDGYFGNSVSLSENTLVVGAYSTTYLEEYYAGLPPGLHLIYLSSFRCCIYLQ